MKRRLTVLHQRRSVLLAGVLAVVGALGGSACDRETFHVLRSPDGRTEVRVALRDGTMLYSVHRDRRRILDPSALGLDLTNTVNGEQRTAPFDRFTLTGVSRREHRATWTPVWGKSSEVEDHFRELTVGLRGAVSPQRSLAVVFRAYDDGIAFRYVVPEQPGFAESVSDRTEFNFAGNWPIHFIHSAAYPPIGPLRLDAVRSIEDGEAAPIRSHVLLSPGQDLWLAVHEAALIDSAPMRLIRTPQPRVPWSLRVEVEATPVATPFETPWRVILIAPALGRLLETRLLETLSPPSRIADPSWIRPGKAMWDRRIRKLTHPAGTYGLDTATFIRLIDFAAAHGIEYLLMDSNWYGDQRNPRSDPRTPVSTINLEAVFAHAARRSVRVLLYVNDTAFLRHDPDEVFATFQAWGAAGVKYGFMRGQGVEKVRKTVALIEAAARHRLLINFHDAPVHPTGLQRTYPNLVAVEFCHAQLDGGRAFTPEEYLHTVFVQMLAGPLDMNNGFFALDTLDTRKTAGLDYDQFYSPVYATVAAEVARILITDTGLGVLPDTPEAYASKDDLFEFVRRLPVGAWDETRVLRAEFGKAITTARRSGREWFIGSVVDEQGGSFRIDLDFLDEGVQYAATVYEDAADSHYQRNREAYRVRTMTVTADTVIEAVMAPGGGHAVWLRP